MLRKSVLFSLLTLHTFFLVAQHPKRELRAAWIATVMNIDWPSQKGLTANQQQSEFTALLDKLADVGMNAVIVQIRPTADAFHPSSYEPWSEYLTGVQGQHPEPYYNPLTFMIEQARLRGMEFHAWFNPYRVSMKSDFIPPPGHPMLAHPEWFVEYGGKWYYDPGHPEGREYVLRSIMETIRHYDVDAVHFDDYFYPYRIANQEFPDDSTYLKYGQAKFPVRDDWRRANVDYFIFELSQRINREKPHVKFGISPFGVWRNRDKDDRGSDTQAGQTNYDDLYADVLKWLQEGWIDYITPQIYWHIGFDKAEYKTLVEWWGKNAYGRHVYIGQGIYRIGEKGWENHNEIVNQVSYNRSFSEVQGSMYFSAKIFASNKLDINKKIDSLYRYKALVPVMSWKKGSVVLAPVPESVSGSPEQGITLRWSDNESSSSAYYIIYRSGKAGIPNMDDPSRIVAVVPRSPVRTQQWTDTSADRRSQYTYAISAADRLHNESAAGKVIRVKTRGRRRMVTGNL